MVYTYKYSYGLSLQSNEHDTSFEFAYMNKHGISISKVNVEDEPILLDVHEIRRLFYGASLVYVNSMKDSFTAVFHN